jgi:hypothetical protein
MGNVRAFCPTLCLLLLLLAPVALLDAAPVLDWDSRLSGLGVTLAPAQDCSGGCWRLITARYEDEQESGGNHNLFSRLYDGQGDMIAGAPWHTAWPGGNVTIYTKAPPEWSDFPIFDCFLPDREQGAYSAYAGDDPAKSDIVEHMGLPACYHVNYRLEWQYQASIAPCTGCTPRGFLPVTNR